MALVLLVVACDDITSKIPTSPGASGGAEIEISGPATIAPGQSAQFTARVRMADGTLKEPASANNLQWRFQNTLFVHVTAAGFVTARQAGEGIVTADMNMSGVAKTSSREVIVLPDGTYRVIGTVVDAEFSAEGIGGARVEVSGATLFAITNSTGQYRLYGVPSDANIQVTSAGYDALTLNLQLTGHTARNSTLTPSGPRPTFVGPYTLTIDAIDACRNPPAIVDAAMKNAAGTTSRASIARSSRQG